MSKKKPLETFRKEGVSISIWEGEGTKGSYLHSKIENSYFKDGAYKTSNYYTKKELLVLRDLIEEACSFFEANEEEVVFSFAGYLQSIPSAWHGFVSYLYHELGENQFKHLFADAEYDYDDAKGFIIILPNSTMKRIILQQCSTFLRAGYERHMGKKFSEEHLKVTIIE